jgi:hypothetical protein
MTEEKARYFQNVLIQAGYTRNGASDAISQALADMSQSVGRLEEGLSSLVYYIGQLESVLKKLAEEGDTE